MQEESIKFQIKKLENSLNLIEEKLKQFSQLVLEGFSFNEFKPFSIKEKNITSLTQLYEYKKILKRKLESAKKILETKAYIKNTSNSNSKKKVILKLPQKKKYFMKYSEEIIIGRSQSSNDKVYQYSKYKKMWYYHAVIKGGSLVINKTSEKSSLCNTLAVLYSKFLKKNK